MLPGRQSCCRMSAQLLLHMMPVLELGLRLLCISCYLFLSSVLLSPIMMPHAPPITARVIVTR